MYKFKIKLLYKEEKKIPELLNLKNTLLLAKLLLATLLLATLFVKSVIFFSASTCLVLFEVTFVFIFVFSLSLKSAFFGGIINIIYAC